MPFRIKMAGISAAAVLVTLAVVLVPVYVLSRDLLTQVLGEQVTAVTRSTSVAISGDSLDRIAERGGTSSNAYRVTRTMLQRMWLANGGSLPEPRNGVSVVRADTSGKICHPLAPPWAPRPTPVLSGLQPPPGGPATLRARPRAGAPI